MCFGIGFVVFPDLATILTTLRLSESGDTAGLGGADRFPGIKLDMKDPILDVSPSEALFLCLGEDALEFGFPKELLSGREPGDEACLETLLVGSSIGDWVCLETLLVGRRTGD